MKKKFSLLFLISLFCFITIPKAINADYLVDGGQVLIWEFDPEEGRKFYLKVTVISNDYPLDLDAYIYDPYNDELSASEEFADIAVNFILNETVIAELERTNENETVERTYGGRDVTCSKITVDSDNIIYVDQDTGVVCDASLDSGDVVYDLKIVAWENKDMSEEYYIGESFSVPGYPFLLVGIISLVSMAILIKKKKETL